MLPMTSVPPPVLPVVAPCNDEEDVLPEFVRLSQLVIVTVTVVYSWLAHRVFSFRRNPAELRLAEQQEAGS